MQNTEKSAFQRHIAAYYRIERHEISMKKILFVCHGNICRSPMAEYVMKDMVRKAGYSVAGIDGTTKDTANFVIASAATSTEETGNGVYPPAKRKLAENGIGVFGNDLGVSMHRAHRMTKKDYEYYDKIICMDYNNIRNLNRIIGGDPDGKVSLLLDYTERAGEEVADPWYTGDFDATWHDVTEGCSALLDILSVE